MAENGGIPPQTRRAQRVKIIGKRFGLERFCYALGSNNYGNGGLVRLVDKTKKTERNSTRFVVIDEFCFVMP